MYFGYRNKQDGCLILELLSHDYNLLIDPMEHLYILYL